MHSSFSEQSLKKLYIQATGLGDEAAKHVARILRENTVKLLICSSS